ncbi:hypothetical protein [Paracoccus zeaxanthinifaciens]|uniref:hypothetical protein n=1 Tax=Paracoccus zeaxanthinifaciens TaxID=187400 RepID=UPI0003B7A6E8|nr:hypothetical protein [Paracoccus zeaxanthinifaciens]
MHINGNLNNLHLRLFIQNDSADASFETSLFSRAITVGAEEIPEPSETASQTGSDDHPAWVARSETYRQAAETARAEEAETEAAPSDPEPAPAPEPEPVTEPESAPEPDTAQSAEPAPAAQTGTQTGSPGGSRRGGLFGWLAG